MKQRSTLRTVAGIFFLLLLIAGTSLVVYPAAGLIDYFSGSHLVIVNRSTTPRDQQADLCISASIGDVMDF